MTLTDQIQLTPATLVSNSTRLPNASIEARTIYGDPNQVLI